LAAEILAVGIEAVNRLTLASRVFSFSDVSGQVRSW